MGAFGRFVWHDLFTADVQAALAFYQTFTGWEATESRDGAVMLRVGGEEIGRIARTPEGSPAPPHWLGYVATQDVDAMSARAGELGGKTLVPPTDIPNVGRFAVVADPQGAVFAVYGSSHEMHEPGRAGAGMFSWAELNTTDWESAWKFYSPLFGWKPTSSMDTGEFGTYFMFGTDEKESMGGMSNAATMMKSPAHWLHYFNVSDITEALQKVEAGGGKVLNGPMEIPGEDWIAQCMDPQGAAFAIYASARK